MNNEGLSLSALVTEREELRKDLEAFHKAYDIICARLLESNETPRQRRPLLHEWSGSRASCGSLELAIHAVERTIAETDMLILKIEDGEIPNIDPPERPRLGVVNGGLE